MSSTTITPAPFRIEHSLVRRPAATAVRLTRRGRLVLLTALLALVAMVMIAVSGLATATRDAAPAQEVRTVTVAPGDTLYGLASEVAEPGKIRETVAEIKQLNSMSGSSLQVGDRVALPLG